MLTPGGNLDVTTVQALSVQLADILARMPEYVGSMSRAGFLDCAAARVIAQAGNCLPAATGRFCDMPHRRCCASSS